MRLRSGFAIISSLMAFLAFAAVCPDSETTDEQAGVRPEVPKEAALCNEAAEQLLDDSNELVLQAIKEMPTGGGYGSETGRGPYNVANHTSLKDGKLVVSTKYAKPSFCTLATYLVFAKVVSKLNLKPEVAKELLMKNMLDGNGIWGRWNSNGPGMSVVANRLKIGTSFNDVDEARPGDFLKIFWKGTKKVAGVGEHGHTVVFLDKTVEGGKEYIHFWSSNQASGKRKGGYGVIKVPASSIQHTIFTRLKSPAEIEQALNDNVPTLPKTDGYLKKLRNGSSSYSEADLESGIIKPKPASTKPVS